jgi:protein-disulfide isomerase
MTANNSEHKGNKKNKKRLIWGIIVLGIILVISIFSRGFGLLAKETENKKRTAIQSGQLDTFMTTLMDDDAVKGDENAPVTIIEWSDYECPYCGRFYSQTFGQIDEQYIETGKVKFVYRDFSLPFHSNAQKAAEAAECAGEQKRYYDMYDKLFREGIGGGVDAFKQYASEIGLDTVQFNDCLDSGRMASETAKDMEDGKAAGITGTPGFIINGELILGAQPFENFKKVIEGKLAE